MTRYAIIFALSILIASCGNRNKNAVNSIKTKTDTINTYFPLTIGNYWFYEGIVKYTLPNSNIVKKKKIKWKMEVTDVIKRQPLTAVVIKGFPVDLAWYEDTTKRGNYLILINSGKYYLNDNSQFEIAINRLKNKKDDLQNIVSDDDLFLDFPLYKGKRYGGTMPLRNDGWYSWQVEKDSSAANTFEISYMSSPDFTSYNFTIGKGITGYKYIHHGTIAECDIKLVSFKINK